MRTNKKVKAEKRGQWGEFWARMYLRLKGYQILESQYKTPVGEIDIIARKSGTVVFVEVKTRKNIDSAHWSILPQQQARITRAANLYIARSKLDADTSYRFDALFIAPYKCPRHFQNAW